VSLKKENKALQELQKEGKMLKEEVGEEDIAETVPKDRHTRVPARKKSKNWSKWKKS